MNFKRSKIKHYWSVKENKGSKKGKTKGNSISVPLQMGRSGTMAGRQAQFTKTYQSEVGENIVIKHAME